MGQCCTPPNNKKKINKYNSRNSEILFEAFSKLIDLKIKYQYICTIGQGAFGRVCLYQEKNSPNSKFAIKTIKKNFVNPYSIQSIEREVNILRQLDHPNIVNYVETYEDRKFIYIVMEYIPGNNLLKLISRKKEKEFSEIDIRKILKVLLTTVQYLHNQKMIHRDLKPSNILFSSDDNYQSMKLIDFGLSINKCDKDSYRVGSPYYMSPELVNGEFCYESDVWSIGVVLFLMATGKQPFQANTKEEVYRIIKRANYDQKALDECHCSDELRDLIKKILVVDPKERLNVSGCLEHVFLSNERGSTGENFFIDHNILKSLRDFNQNNILQKEILFLMARISSETEIANLRKVFSLFDKDNSGEIEYRVFPQVFEKLGFRIQDQEMKQIFDELDFHKDGRVNYSEFLAATLNSIKFEKETKLWSVFQYFDPNNTGFITADSVINTLKERELNVNESELNDLFKSLKNTGERMDFSEFRDIFYSSSRKNSYNNEKKDSMSENRKTSFSKERKKRQKSVQELRRSSFDSIHSLNIEIEKKSINSSKHITDPIENFNIHDDLNDPKINKNIEKKSPYNSGDSSNSKESRKS